MVSEKKEAAPMVEGHNPRVLVIDDADEMRAVIRRVLAADGYHVDDVSTVAEARALGLYGYQAILVDVQIGLERGSSLVREMVAADPDVARRCLMITGGSLDDIPEGIPYLAKPFKPDQLQAAVRALLRPGHGDRRPPARSLQPPVGGPTQGTARETAIGVEQGRTMLALIRLVRMRERRDLADRLHDGPIQDLSAAALGLHLLHNQRKSEQTDLLESAIRQVDQAGRAMRSLMENQERGGLPREDMWLASAVRDQTAWLLASPAAVDVDPPQPGLPAEQVSLVAGVAELMLFLLAGEDPPPSAHLSIQVGHDAIRIDVAVTMAGGSEITRRQPAYPPNAHARLRDLATALEATVQADPDRVQAQLTLPWARAGNLSCMGSGSVRS